MRAELCSLYHPLSQKTLIDNNASLCKAVNRATNPLFLTTKKLAANDRIANTSSVYLSRIVFIHSALLFTQFKPPNFTQWLLHSFKLI